MLDLLMFDIDGTLADQETGELLPDAEAVINALRAMPQRPRVALITNQRGPAWRWATGDAKFPSSSAVAQRVVRVAQLVEANFVAVAIGDTRLVARAGVGEMLIGVARELLMALGGAGIEAAVTPGGGNAKPSPYLLLTALEEFNIAPERAIYVGDRPEDRAAAEAAGVPFLPAERIGELLAFVEQGHAG